MLRNINRLIDSQSWAYIARSATGYADRRRWTCPCCSLDTYRVISRKSLVTALVRCQACQLLYRTPCDPVDTKTTFYQEDYISGGLTTSLPGKAHLQQLLATGFRGTDKNFLRKIGVLKALGLPKDARVLDFGASWGYATWQLKQAGYDAVGFEISAPRAAFGRNNLGIDIVMTEKELAGPFDVFFSSHVIEHLANPREAFALAQRLLCPGGMFVAFTPNGSELRLANGRRSYNHSWGRLHPIYLDEVFYRHNLRDVPKFFMSRCYGSWSDIGAIARWDRESDAALDLTEPELLAIWINSPG